MSLLDLSLMFFPLGAHIRKDANLFLGCTGLRKKMWSSLEGPFRKSLIQ